VSRIGAVIVNLETLRFQPRASDAVAKAYAAEIDELSGAASLIGYWDVEVGSLNSAMLLWGFDDDATGETAHAPRWPSSLEGVVTSSEPLILEPASFNGPIEPGSYGPIYEIRIYDYEAGSIGTVIDRWTDMVAERRSISRLIGCFSSSGGPVEKWVHIWAYRDGRERELARAEAARRRIWPPDTGEWLLHQENMIVIPAKLSPLQ
jgi:NIPSNAP